MKQYQLVILLIVFSTLFLLKDISAQNFTTSRDRPHLFLCFYMGSNVYNGRLNKVFKDNGPNLFRISLGYEKRNFTFELGLEKGGTSHTEEYIAESGYLSETISVDNHVIDFNLGYALIKKGKFAIIPLVGISKRWLREDPMSAHNFDPHPNWDLNASSHYKIHPGVSFRYVFSHTSYNAVYIQYKRVSYDYQNPEYESGFFLTVLMGMSINLKGF